MVSYTEKAFTKCNRKGNSNTKSFGIMKFGNKQNSLLKNNNKKKWLFESIARNYI